MLNGAEAYPMQPVLRILAHGFASIEDAPACKAQGEDTKVQFVAGWAILYAL